MLLQCCPCLTSIHFFVCSVKWEDYSKACRYTQSSFWRDICAKLFNSKQKGHSSNLFCSRLHDMVRWYSSVCTTHKYTWCQRLPNETLCLFCCQNKTTFFLRVKQKADGKTNCQLYEQKRRKSINKLTLSLVYSKTVKFLRTVSILRPLKTSNLWENKHKTLISNKSGIVNDIWSSFNNHTFHTFIHVYKLHWIHIDKK